MTDIRLLDVSTKDTDAYVLLDAEDYQRFKAWSWRLSSKGYVYRTDGGTIWLHREIMNAPDGMEVDHINHNPLDNRRENLRVCTPQENRQNSRPNEGRGLKGVFKHAKGKWEAAIVLDKKRHYLGLYDEPQYAAIAYDVAARILFGKFANPNLESPTLRDLLEHWLKENECPEPALTEQHIEYYSREVVKTQRAAIEKQPDGLARVVEAIGPDKVAKLCKSRLSDFYWSKTLGVPEDMVKAIRRHAS